MELSSLWMMKGRLSSQPSTTRVVYKVSENRLDSPLLLLPVGESNPQAKCQWLSHALGWPSFEDPLGA